MKIIIIGKRDQMGTIPLIRVKGMSRFQYNFEWDKESRHYAYEPKNQREADDIFRTQGKLYKRMFFSVLMEEKNKEVPKKEKKETPKKEKKAVKKKDVDHHFEKEVSKLQAVVEEKAES